MKSAKAIAERISAELTSRSEPEKAAPMAAYMKTEMPFLGVQKAGRVAAWRAVRGEIEIADGAGYERAVLALWKRPHREEKYMALVIARAFSDFITLDALALYERLIREGAWWDFVDDIAVNLVGALWTHHPKVVGPKMDAWIKDDDMWIRRTAIIGQNKRREATDARRLFRYCRARAFEKEFFIRKAIGWALREYSYSAPERVIDFLSEEKESLAPLSYREGAKALVRQGLM